MTAVSSTSDEDTYRKFTATDENASSKPSPKNQKKSGKEKVPEMSVLLQLLGPLANMKIRSIRKTVWFWGILLGEGICIE